MRQNKFTLEFHQVCQILRKCLNLSCRHNIALEILIFESFWLLELASLNILLSLSVLLQDFSTCILQICLFHWAWPMKGSNFLYLQPSQFICLGLPDFPKCFHCFDGCVQCLFLNEHNPTCQSQWWRTLQYHVWLLWHGQILVGILFLISHAIFIFGSNFLFLTFRIRNHITQAVL